MDKELMIKPDEKMAEVRPDKLEKSKYAGLIERTKGHRFQPGESGNPDGRPKKDYSITSQAKLIIDKEPDVARRIARKWLDDAIKGKTEARRDFQDRTEGKSPDILQISGPIAIVVINENGTQV